MAMAASPLPSGFTSQGIASRLSSAIDRAYHSELVTVCAGMMEAQVAEITQLRTWLCQWYSVCSYGPKGVVGEMQ